MRSEGPLVLIDTEGVRLVYYPATKIVHHEFHRFVRGAELREALETGLEAFIKYGASKWLSDDRMNGPVTPEDAAFGRDSWTPRVMAAGWRFWAVVMPEKVLGQMNMRRWIAAFREKGLVADAFANPDIAMRWLEQQRG
jgi:hypothetical protein